MIPSPLNDLKIGLEYLDVSLSDSAQEVNGEKCSAEIDLLILESAEGRHAESGQACRAMERLANRHATADDTIRVANLPPSGRPLALLGGEQTALRVSASHARGLIVAACRVGTAGVGVDLVDPASAGNGLDWWTDEKRASGKTNTDRAFFWAAREAAYKAALLDMPFCPAAIHVAFLEPDRFAWRIVGSEGPLTGHGQFFFVGDCLMAVAVEHCAVPHRLIEREAIGCS